VWSIAQHPEIAVELVISLGDRLRDPTSDSLPREPFLAVLERAGVRTQGRRRITPRARGARQLVD
jgi:hypothetical protein